jgi:NRPS condensation-like uncharacterized protein
MNKEPTNLGGLTRKTEPFPESPKGEPGMMMSDQTVIMNIGLRQSEIERLGAIASENHVTRNNLVAHALRRFIRQYDAGKARIVKKALTTKKP